MANTQKISFLYRDGSNYKFLFTAAIDIEKTLAVDDEIEYEQIGFTQDSFHSNIVKYDYDPESDHNLLVVEEILDAEAPVEHDLTNSPTVVVIFGMHFYIKWDNDNEGYDQRGIKWINKAAPECTKPEVLDIVLDNYNSLIKKIDAGCLHEIGAIIGVPESIVVQGRIDTGQIFLNGKFLDIKKSQQVENKSQQFSWGYGGSGAAQLALAILCNYLPVDLSLKLFQSFKFAVIGGWPQEDIQITLDLRAKILSAYEKYSAFRDIKEKHNFKRIS